MADQNPFGGKNPLSLYVPMSETEQELIDRLRSAGDFKVLLHGWGRLDNPPIQVGDLQVVVPIDIVFNAPSPPIPVWFFDLELCTQSGVTLFREKQPTVYQGQPLMVGAGTHLQMVWHIAVRAMDPTLVRSLMPGARGMTSRAFDKDTGSLTSLGNYHLDTATQRLLGGVRRGEEVVREDKAKTLAKIPQ